MKNRTRKSKGQKEALWELYKKLKGETPPRDQITKLSAQLNLKENQIYKWFWDTKKKVEEDTELARKMNMGSSSQSRNAMGANRRGFSRMASNISSKSGRECIGVDGKDGHGEQMTP